MARRKQQTEGLTPRQQEIHDLAAEGLTVKQAAKRLGLAESGIYNHTRRIRDKGYAVNWKSEEAAPVEAAPTNGGAAAATLSPHLSAVADARHSLVSDAGEYAERIREALGDRHQRLDENRTEAERIKSEAEELGREIKELDTALADAERLAKEIASLESEPAIAST